MWSLVIRQKMAGIDSGHAVNPAPNTGGYHAVVLDWMRSIVGH